MTNETFFIKDYVIVIGESFQSTKKFKPYFISIENKNKPHIKSKSTGIDKRDFEKYYTNMELHIDEIKKRIGFKD